MVKRKHIIFFILVFLLGWALASYALSTSGFLVRIKDNQAAKATFLQAINPFYSFINPAVYYLLFPKQK